MSKIDWNVMIGIIVVTVITALLLNLSLSIDGFIPTKFENHQWLSFWATYLTGIFALIIGYLAISFANKNSEKALQQQTEVLRQQENGRIKGEILCRIKKQFELFNVLEYSSALYCCDQKDNTTQIQRLVDERARLHKECNTWCLFVPLYLQSPKLEECVKEYQKCWSESTDILDEFLKLQIRFLQKAKEQDSAILSKGIYDQILAIINQKSDIQSESTLYDINTYKKEREEQQGIEDETRDEIRKLSFRISTVLNSLLKAQDNMEQASVLLLKRINMIDFTNDAFCDLDGAYNQNKET